MRESVFRVIHEQPGHVEARAEREAITITAPSLEELHHEARDALIQLMGPAHVSVRVRIRRDHDLMRCSNRKESARPTACLKPLDPPSAGASTNAPNLKFTSGAHRAPAASTSAPAHLSINPPINPCASA